MHVVPLRHKLWTLGHKPSTREPSQTSKTSIRTMGLKPPSSQLCHGCKDTTHHHIIIKIVIIASPSIQSLFILIKNLIYFNHKHHINAIPLLQQHNYHNITVTNTTQSFVRTKSNIGLTHKKYFIVFLKINFCKTSHISNFILSK